MDMSGSVTGLSMPGEDTAGMGVTTDLLLEGMKDRVMSMNDGVNLNINVGNGMNDPGMDNNVKPTTVTVVPKRFKSSFIFFSMEKHKHVKKDLEAKGISPKSTNITQLVGQAWRELSAEEKKKYEDLAKEDKMRYDQEKANYKKMGGPKASKRKSRDPDAPKRPMSAFLAYANSRRAAVKKENPEFTNGEISKLLSRKWKEVSDEVKQEYRENETALWTVYKEKMLVWRKDNDGKKRALKASQAAAAKKKKRKTKNKSFDEESLPETTFDDPNFGGVLVGNMDQGNTNNQDDIMAASAALRGVRASGNGMLPFSGSIGTGGSGQGIGGGGAGFMGLDIGSMQQGLHQGAGGNLSALLSSNSGGNSMNGSGGLTQNSLGQDYNGNRSLLEMGLPLQQYGWNAGILGNNNPQAMLAALRGNSGGILGLGAGAQNGIGGLGQSQSNPSNLQNFGNGINLGGGLSGNIGNGIGNMNGGLMNGLMNDNSNSRFGSDTMNNLHFQ